MSKSPGRHGRGAHGERIHMESKEPIEVQVRKAVACEISPALNRIEKRIPRIEESVDRYVPRRPLTEKTKKRHRDVILHLGGRCPCCGEVFVVTEDGGVIEAEYDHFYSRERRSFQETWLVCKPCHKSLTSSSRADKTVEFQAYQRKAVRFDRHSLRPMELFAQ